MITIALSDNAAAALVDILSDEYLDATARDNEIMNWMPMRDRVGLSIKQPVKSATTTSHGANDALVLSRAGNVARKFFEPAFIPNYAAALVTQHEINVSSDDETAIVNILADNITDCRKRLAIDQELAFAGDGFGTRFIVQTFTGSGPWVITATSLADVADLNVGDVFVFSAANNSSSLDNSGAEVQITSVDKDAGTVTMAQFTGSGGPTNAHYAFLSADKISGEYSTALKVFGFDAYLPMINRTTVLAGLDRSSDPQSFSGVYVKASGKSIRAAVNIAFGRLKKIAEASIDTIFMGTETYQRFEDELGNNRRYVETKDFMVNGEKLAFQGPRGLATVMSSHAIKEDRIYVLSRDTWIYWNAMKGDMIGFGTQANKSGLVDNYNTFGTQIRQMTDGNTTNSLPGANAVVQLV